MSVRIGYDSCSNSWYNQVPHLVLYCVMQSEVRYMVWWLDSSASKRATDPKRPVIEQLGAIWALNLASNSMLNLQVPDKGILLYTTPFLGMRSQNDYCSSDCLFSRRFASWFFVSIVMVFRQCFLNKKTLIPDVTTIVRSCFRTIRTVYFGVLTTEMFSGSESDSRTFKQTSVFHSKVLLVWAFLFAYLVFSKYFSQVRHNFFSKSCYYFLEILRFYSKSFARPSY